MLEFAKFPWKQYTFNEILKLTNLKSRSYVQGILSSFKSDKLILIEKKANLNLYSLNLKSEKAKAYACMALEYHAWNLDYLPYRNLEKLIKKIPQKNYVFLITGSYAKNKQKETSDIDVVIIIDDNSDPKRTYAELSHYAGLARPEIHLYVFRNSEFIIMLTNNEANYGKEIVKNCILLKGAEVYLKLIQEAINNGFYDKKLS